MARTLFNIATFILFLVLSGVVGNYIEYVPHHFMSCILGGIIGYKLGKIWKEYVYLEDE